MWEKVFLFRARPLPISYMLPLHVQGILLVLVIAVAITLYMLAEGIMVKLWLLAGLGFGLIGYLTRICWATGLREITNPYYGGGRMVTATGTALLVYAILAYPLVLHDPAYISFALAGG